MNACLYFPEMTTSQSQISERSQLLGHNSEIPLQKVSERQFIASPKSRERKPLLLRIAGDGQHSQSSCMILWINLAFFATTVSSASMALAVFLLAVIDKSLRQEVVCHAHSIRELSSASLLALTVALVQPREQIAIKVGVARMLRAQRLENSEWQKGEGDAFHDNQSRRGHNDDEACDQEAVQQLCIVPQVRGRRSTTPCRTHCTAW